jgi:hypothetical protein
MLYYNLMIGKKPLEKMYHLERKSMQEIADTLGHSLHKVAYWMDKHKIKSRSRSEATYIKHNPNGDPFKIKTKLSKKETKLHGLGLGLYWGEGTKADTHSLRLGNTDPLLIKKFIDFLVKIYGVKKKDLRLGLQIFSDMDPEKALRFWITKLGIDRNQFQKVVVTQSKKQGIYRKKVQHGVLTVQYHRKKLRDIVNEQVEQIAKH